jgi:AcrR family transcriptional regulator
VLYHSVSRQAREADISSEIAVSDTRTEFLRVARRLFAERGFYGTSLAAIAAELGLTKQALIHHFGTKERLYDEVLANMADRLAIVVDRARRADPDPARQLERLLFNVFDNLFDHPDDTQLLMRELLDNRARAERARSWRMKAFLDALVALLRRTPGGEALSQTEALARVYMLIGALSYFAVSEPTLRRMYGEDAFNDLKVAVPLQARRIVRTPLSGA